MKQYRVISDRWAHDEVVCTIEDLQSQAKCYTNDRIGSGEINDAGPVTITIEGDHIIDDTGETIAVEAITVENLGDNVVNVLDMAETSGGALSIASHERGYTHVIAEINQYGAVLDAWTTETTDGYYRSSNPNYHSLIRVGTGSVPCNCDACSRGDDPAEWADEGEFWPDYEQQVSEFVLRV